MNALLKLGFIVSCQSFFFLGREREGFFCVHFSFSGIAGVKNVHL